MARTKGAKKTTRRFKPAVTDGRNLKTLTIGVSMLFGSAAVAGGIWWGVGKLEQRAGAHLYSGQTTVQIVWPSTQTGTPDGERAEHSWLPAVFRGEITDAAQAAADKNNNVLDPAQLRDVGNALIATGWFEGQPTVERTGDGSIRVTGDWRAPACAVRFGDRDYLVGWDRKRLPPDYPVGRSGQRVILGVAGDPPRTDAGASYRSAWPGDDIDAALILLRTLHGDPIVFEDVAAIDAGDFARSGTLAIITQRGTRVVWGGRPDDFHPGQITTPAKLERLRTLLDRYGGIDAGQQAIEIAWDRPLIIDTP